MGWKFCHVHVDGWNPENPLIRDTAHSCRINATVLATVESFWKLEIECSPHVIQSTLTNQYCLTTKQQFKKKASKQASKQAIKQTNKQTINQSINQSNKQSNNQTKNQPTINHLQSSIQNNQVIFSLEWWPLHVPLGRVCTIGSSLNSLYWGMVTHPTFNDGNPEKNGISSIPKGPWLDPLRPLAWYPSPVDIWISFPSLKRTTSEFYA